MQMHRLQSDQSLHCLQETTKVQQHTIMDLWLKTSKDKHLDVNTSKQRNTCISKIPYNE